MKYIELNKQQLIVQEDETTLDILRDMCEKKVFTRTFSEWKQLETVNDLLLTLGFTTLFRPPIRGSKRYILDRWFGNDEDMDVLRELINVLCSEEYMSSYVGKIKNIVAGIEVQKGKLFDIYVIKRLLASMYANKERALYFMLNNDDEWEEIESMCLNIASRNAAKKEHPVDSLIGVLEDPLTVYDEPIQDLALPRFIKQSVILSVLQLTIFEYNGMNWFDAIDLCRENGFFTYLAVHGRFIASDDYRWIIDTLKGERKWLEG